MTDPLMRWRPLLEQAKDADRRQWKTWVRANFDAFGDAPDDELDRMYDDISMLGVNCFMDWAIYGDTDD